MAKVKGTGGGRGFILVKVEILQKRCVAFLWLRKPLDALLGAGAPDQKARFDSLLQEGAVKFSRGTGSTIEPIRPSNVENLHCRARTIARGMPPGQG